MSIFDSTEMGLFIYQKQKNRILNRSGQVAKFAFVAQDLGNNIEDKKTTMFFCQYLNYLYFHPFIRNHGAPKSIIRGKVPKPE